MAQAVVPDIHIGASDGTKPAFDSAARNASALGGKLRGAFRQMRAHTAQLGMQIQDVAVQLQGGTAAAVVFAQQGSQIASLFGPAGAVIGALLAVGTALAGTLIPGLLRGSSEAEKFHTRIVQLVGGFEKLNQEAKQLAINSLVKTIADLNEEILETQKKFDRVTDSLDMGGPAVELYKDSMTLLSRAIEKVGNSEESVNEELQLLLANMQKQAELLNSYLNPELQETSDHMKSVAEAIKQLDTFITPAQAALDALNGTSAAATAESKNYKEALAEATDAEKKFNHSMELVNINFGKLAGNKIPMAQEGFTTLKTKVKEGAVSFHELEKSAAFVAMTMDDVQSKSIMNLEDNLVGLIDGTKSVKDAFKDMARSVINDLIRMTIQRQITAPLFGALFPTAPGGTYTTIQGSASPTVGGSDVHFEGGGFTGYGARSGGVDGRGGFPAILHPNETVIDHTKGQSTTGDVNVTVNINGSGNAKNDIMEALPFIVSATKNAIIDSKRRGGSFNSVMRT